MRLKPPPTEIPEFTASPAGYLVTSNGGWRSFRPVIDKSRCAGCGQCYLYCPDGTISLDFEVNYSFCKGCGICAKICKHGAVAMIAEGGYA